MAVSSIQHPIPIPARALFPLVLHVFDGELKTERQRQVHHQLPGINLCGFPHLSLPSSSLFPMVVSLPTCWMVIETSVG